MAINDILEIGRQALAANRQAMQTTSNNIANANTPGYTRQRPVFQSNEQSLSQGVRLGGGVEIKHVVRAHDLFVHKQVIEESKTFGASRTRLEGLRRVEGTVANEGFRIGDLVNKFFNDVRDLSANPEMAALKSTVAASADTTAAGFRKMRESLQTLKSDMDSQLSFAIEDINNLTTELASLNGKIHHFEATGETPNELLDRRDTIQRDLSQRLGFDTFTDDHGHVNITAGGLGVLVQGTDARTFVVQRTPEKDIKTAGDVEIFVKEPGGIRNVTAAIKEGELGGMLHVRDRVVNKAIDQLDRAAFEFASAVNRLHQEGEGGHGLFTNLEEVKDAAHNIDLSEAVRQGAENIAAGYSSDAAGDNRIALEIARLQEAKIMPLTLATSEIVEDGQTQTVNEALNAMVGQIGVATQAEEQTFRHQEAVMNQLDNYRQSISGVSLEEEAINMMQFQAVFNASAKAMKVGDELFETILSLKD